MTYQTSLLDYYLILIYSMFYYLNIKTFFVITSPQRFSFHSFKTSCRLPPRQHPPSLSSLFSLLLHWLFSVLHFFYSSLSTLSPFWFVTHCHLSHKVPRPAFSFMHVFSSTNTSPCIPAFIPPSLWSTSPPCCVSLYLLLLPPVTNALPSSVCLPHKLTLSLCCVCYWHLWRMSQCLTACMLGQNFQKYCKGLSYQICMWV